MKKIGIEALLCWSYQTELPKTNAAVRGITGAIGPKAPGSGHAAAALASEYWCLPDNHFGVVVDPMAMESPHDDAFAVARAVRTLSDFEIEVPADWQPMAEFNDLGQAGRTAVRDALERATAVDDCGRRLLKKTPERLVVHYAIMGGAPDWHIDRPRVELVRKPNGTPAWFRKQRIPDATDADDNIISWRAIEADGFNKKARRPFDDAYQKHKLEPDPIDGLIGRAEYEVWRAALDVIAEELEGKLVDHVLLPCERPWRPWEEGEMPAPRVILSNRMKVV